MFTLVQFERGIDTIKKVGTQATNWEMIYVTHVTNKGLVFRIYQEFLQISKKKTNSPVKKGGGEGAMI